MFASETIRAFIDAGTALYNEMILVNVVGDLPVRIRAQFKNRKVGKVHQNMLVFYKGDPKKIKDNFEEISGDSLDISTFMPNISS